MLILIFCNYAFKHNFFRQGKKRHYHMYTMSAWNVKTLGNTQEVSWFYFQVKKWNYFKEISWIRHQQTLDVLHPNQTRSFCVWLYWKQLNSWRWLSFDPNESLKQIQHELKLVEIQMGLNNHCEKVTSNQKITDITVNNC